MAASDKEVFEASASGDAVLLDEVLRQMNISERSSALERKQTHLTKRGWTIYKCTPLIVATVNGNLDCVKVLLKYKGDIESRCDGCGSYHSYTPLLIAAFNGYFDVLSCLVENGADVNKGTGDINCTPLMIASRNGHVNSVALLIRHGADMDLKDKNGRTALHCAAEKDLDSCEVLSCLVENGADVNKGTDDINCTPLMIASRNGNVNNVACLIRNGADVDLQDEYGKTALYYAVENYHGSCEVLSCLLENGADVNKGANNNCTPLMIASKKGHVNNVALLIRHGADIDLQDKNGRTALHYAVENYRGSCEVLSCLLENGADVNKGTDDINCTPLMIASRKGQVNVVALLIRDGANIECQDKCGNTALHHAVIGDSPDVVHNLLILGASQLYNNDRLTPLLLASNECKVLMVEDLIKRPECIKKLRIDALELLGASVAVSAYPEGAFQHMKRGMEERFQDPSNPLPKQLMEPNEAYQNRKESETCEELSLIEGDTHAVRMEGFVMRERILGPDNRALIQPIRFFARELQFRSASKTECDSCIGLYIHSLKIAERCNEDIAVMIRDLQSLIHVLFKRQYDFPPSQKVILEVLEQAILVFEKLREKFGGKFQVELLYKDWGFKYPVLDSMLLLLQLLTKDELCGELCEEDINSSGSQLLQKLCSMNLCDSDGNTLLHLAAGQIPGGGIFRKWFPRDLSRIKVMKLLLNVGRSNVNAINNKGDTPLHRAATLDLQDHLITDMMQTLLDGGAHHDFTNNDGKTAMDLAVNVEAYNFLSEKKRLSELTCISARAVKKFGLPYLGVVPKTLEKFISMH